MDQKNHKIKDLRGHLFEQLDRLNDPECNLEKELQKANAFVNIGNVIINSAKVEIDAMRIAGIKQSDFIPIENALPPADHKSKK